MKPARGFYLPEPGSPHWLPQGEPAGGLLYLAWGRRFYGRYPIPLRLHHGWTYMVVLSGHPTLLVGDSMRRTATGSLIVAGPDVAYGWKDSPAASCALLVWVWTQQPAFGSALETRSCWLRKADNAALLDLQELHRRTRREIQQPDGQSPDAVAAIKVLVDATLARCASGGTASETRDAQRLQLAEQWMRRHLDLRAPAGALSDYLGLSAMGLQRLFRKTTRMSPGRAFHELKMREAQRLLCSPGTSIKEVAFALGYAHAGDFTRAFAKFHGQSPSLARLAPPDLRATS